MLAFLNPTVFAIKIKPREQAAHLGSVTRLYNIYFCGWVLRCVNTVTVIWRLFSLTRWPTNSRNNKRTKQWQERHHLQTLFAFILSMFVSLRHVTILKFSHNFSSHNLYYYSFKTFLHCFLLWYLLHMTLLGLTCWPERNWANFLISILASAKSSGS